MCCWCQTDLNWRGRKSNSNDHSLQGVQKSISKPVEPSSKWATVAGDYFCHLRTGNWCYNLHAVTKTWPLRLEKSPFVLRHLAGVWMWREEYKSMDPANTEQENERTLIYCGAHRVVGRGLQLVRKNSEMGMKRGQEGSSSADAKSCLYQLLHLRLWHRKIAPHGRFYASQGHRDPSTQRGDQLSLMQEASRTQHLM